MIDIELIKRNYASMTDDQLTHLLKKESSDLTEEALTLLQSEMNSRGLNSTRDSGEDETVIERPDAHIDHFYDQISSLWPYAFDQRKNGKSDEEILKALKESGLSEEHAALIIKRLPKINYTDAEFEQLIYKAAENASLSSGLGMLAMAGFSIFLLYWGFKMFFVPIILLGLGMAGAGFYIYRKHQGEFKGSQFWVEMIRDRPDNIVWIKPIVVRHTVGIVITLFKERKFQLSTKDNLSLPMNCNSAEQQQVFFEGVKHYLPHAQLGYTYEISNLYGTDPENFIDSLLRRGLYTPIDKLVP